MGIGFWEVFDGHLTRAGFAAGQGLLAAEESDLGGVGHEQAHQLVVGGFDNQAKLLAQAIHLAEGAAHFAGGGVGMGFSVLGLAPWLYFASVS